MIAGVIGYFKNVVEEFKKISFPSRTVVFYETLLVIIAIVLGVIFVALADYIFTALIRLVITQ